MLENALVFWLAVTGAGFVVLTLVQFATAAVRFVKRAHKALVFFEKNEFNIARKSDVGQLDRRLTLLERPDICEQTYGQSWLNEITAKPKKKTSKKKG